MQSLRRVYGAYSGRGTRAERGEAYSRRRYAVIAPLEVVLVDQEINILMTFGIRKEYLDYFKPAFSDGGHTGYLWAKSRGVLIASRTVHLVAI